LKSFEEPVGQIARWLEFLSEFDFVVEHRPGKSHANADGLSRRPSTEGSPDNTRDVTNVDNGKCVMAVSKQKIEESSSWIPRMPEDQIRQAQQNDQVLVPLIESLRAGERPVRQISKEVVELITSYGLTGKDSQ
jgi:hypothetical protein